jgi:hypothetical protein
VNCAPSILIRLAHGLILRAQLLIAVVQFDADASKAVVDRVRGLHPANAGDFFTALTPQSEIFSIRIHKNLIFRRDHGADDFFRDLRDDGISESFKTVHPVGYPMRYSTHPGFSEPFPFVFPSAG